MSFDTVPGSEWEAYQKRKDIEILALKSGRYLGVPFKGWGCMCVIGGSKE